MHTLYHDRIGYANFSYITIGQTDLRPSCISQNPKKMKKGTYNLIIEDNSETVKRIKESAHALHASVNQTYDKMLPYGFHLDMVVDSVYRYGHLVCSCDDDVLPLFFGAYYHDSIEDARLTYNDTTKTALRYMTERQAYVAAEIVYALTNDKGRNRAERAGERYYKGIRETPYAPFVKLADRLANIRYSFTHCNESNVYMKEVYRGELPHFLAAITVNTDDIRLSLPKEMVEELQQIVSRPM